MLQLSLLLSSLPMCTDAQKIILVVGYHFLLRYKDGVSCELFYLPEICLTLIGEFAKDDLGQQILPRMGVGYLAISVDILIVTAGKGYWSLAGRGQECCCTSCSAQGQLPQQRTLKYQQWLKISIVPRLENTDLGYLLSSLLLIHTEASSRMRTSLESVSGDFKILKRMSCWAACSERQSLRLHH